MKRRTVSRLLAAALAAALLLLTACGGKGSPATADPNADQTGQSGQTEQTVADYAEKLFDTSFVHTVDIAISEEDWSDLRANPLEKTKYHADVTIDGEKVGDVSFATKGNTSLTAVAGDADSDRYSFKINFGKYVKGQTYHGLNKLSLNNIYADATYMKDYLSYEIFRQAGVEAPLVSYVWVTVNGADHGLYIAIEDVSESFLDRTNGGKGVLYKPETEQLANMAQQGGPGGKPGGQMPTPPGDGQIPTPPEGGQTPTPPGDGQTPGRPGDGQMPTPPGDGQMPTSQEGGQMPGQPGGMGFGTAKGADLAYSDDSIDSYSDIFDNNETDAGQEDMQRVIAALKGLSGGTDLEKYLDTDQIIRYFAAHNFVLSYDSYTGNMLHNYYLLEDGGKLSMLPWDYNLAFGAFGGSGDATSLINTGIDTPLSGVSENDRPMWNWIVSDETYLARYHQVYDQLLKSFFEPGDCAGEIARLYEMLRPFVEKDPSAFCSAEEFDAAVNMLKGICQLRAESIRAQLDGTLSTRTDQQDVSARVDGSSIEIRTMGSHGQGQGGLGGRPDNSGQPFPPGGGR
ncbi:MAG: CotH kinase family protein [Oscillospiraceae bacterium]|nr:CotH kinase family protein [Oscillospiraceae bacterium]